MTTTTLDKPVTVSKRKVPEYIKSAADAAERRAKGLPLDKPKVRARGRREKSTLDEARAAVAEERAKRDAKAAVKTKAVPRPSRAQAVSDAGDPPHAGPRPQCHRREISKACTALGCRRLTAPSRRSDRTSCRPMPRCSKRAASRPTERRRSSQQRAVPRGRPFRVVKKVPRAMGAPLSWLRR